MKITAIEIIPIYPRIAARNEAYQVRFGDINRRTVFRVETDAGVTGYGDYRCPAPPRSTVEPLIGCSPFDFINNDFNPGLCGALYDVMGKYLGVPAHKLMGQKVRDGVAVAAWTRPAAPAQFREEVQRAIAQGYTIFKMHTAEIHDVMEQTRVVEEIAPPGFRLHYDFNGNRTLAAVLPTIRALEEHHPIVGFIEDPLVRRDLDSWQRLRAQTRIPLVMHVPPLGGLQEVIHGVADAYMVGEAGLGDALTRGMAYGRANIQTIVQLTGGTLTKALALHLAAVLPTVGHSINLDDQYEEDITTERIPVIEGSSPIPEAPGLGVEVDEAALERVAAREPTVFRRYVSVLRLPGGHTLYTPRFPSVSQLTGYEEGTIRGLRTELMDDDGSPEFERLYERVHSEGVVVADDV